MPYLGDELHHFGWNACSSALCPTAPHPHVERRYLVVPGLRSSPASTSSTPSRTRASPQVVKMLEAEELGKRAGYSRPHTVHCGPEGMYVIVPRRRERRGGPGGVALLDHDTFEVLGQWEADRGAQYLAYDLWWHIGHDVAVTSEWGTPSMIEDGVVPELLLGRKYGHRLHFWDLRTRASTCRPSTSATSTRWRWSCGPRTTRGSTYGFVGVVSASRTCRRRSGCGTATATVGGTKVITIRPSPPTPRTCRRRCKPFGAVPPLVTDIDLSRRRPVPLRLLLGHR